MPKILIYTTPSCVYCKKAKVFFANHNLAYQELNVVEDEKARDAMIQKSGQWGVPVIDIDSKIFVGFNEREIAKALHVSQGA